MSTEPHRYEPDYAAHPGEVIQEMLDEADMRQAHLAGACRVSPKHMNQVCKGVKPLHARLAVDIEIAFGKRCAHVLMRMQADYDVHAARAAAIDRIKAVASLLGPSGGAS